MGTNRFTTYASLLALTAVIACSGGFPAEFPAPDFTLTSPLTGREVRYAALKGKPVIIYWFTSW